jgi:hypothetical protein
VESCHPNSSHSMKAHLQIQSADHPTQSSLLEFRRIRSMIKMEKSQQKNRTKNQLRLREGSDINAASSPDNLFAHVYLHLTIHSLTKYLLP